ncbi:MAG: zinc ribbon domain-containing protein [Acidobacteria bacterium]|nr:zinc ribbon domain-containing protein [Acidobacteriota bacterium]
MPLYEYECDACGHRFEVIQKFSDDPLTTCPKCGGSVRKLLSSPAIQFKGSGWYITDYAKKTGTGAGSTAKSESSGEKSSTGSSEGSTASPAPKSDAPGKSSTPSS